MIFDAGDCGFLCPESECKFFLGQTCLLPGLLENYTNLELFISFVISSCKSHVFLFSILNIFSQVTHFFNLLCKQSLLYVSALSISPDGIFCAAFPVNKSRNSSKGHLASCVL